MKDGMTPHFLQQKKTWGYLIVYLSTALVLGCLSVFYLDSDFLFLLIRIIQISAFAGLGIVHTVMVERGISFLEDRFQSRLSFSALLAGIICVGLFVLYATTNRSMLFMSLAGSCAFFIPYTVREAWNMYIKTPESRSLVWYGYNDQLDAPDVVYLSSIPVTFKLEVGRHDKTPLSFYIKAPLQMELHRMFNLFVLAAEKNYNINIDAVDENDRFYGWQFFAEYLKGLLSLQLDPDMSVGDNKSIKPDMVIFVKRVEATGALADHSRKKLNSGTIQSGA